MTSLTLSALPGTGRTPPAPTRLALSDAQSLQIEAWLRIVPGKRYVAKANWKGQTVLAKLFVGPRVAAKVTQEEQGTRRLLEASIATPAVLDSGNDGQCAWLLMEFLEGAQDLFELTGRSAQQIDHSLAGAHYGEHLAARLAALHRAGLSHDDCHPGNFLFRGEDCYLIDSAAITPLKGEQAQITGIGQLMAQLPDSWWPSLWAAYQQAAAPSFSPAAAQEAAIRHLAWRGENTAKKSLRDCTQFQVSQRFDRFQSVLRAEAEGLAPLLDDLDGVIDSGQPLKQGGSATVVKVEWQGRPLVIKRYNRKNWRHRVSRWFRPTRAWHSWQGGNRLLTLGIATPKPLAMVEERFGPLRGRGYLITESSAGKGLVQSVQEGGESCLSRLLPELGALLKRFRDHHIAHGDFKGTNLLWDGEQVAPLALIDLDVIRWHNNPRRWRKHYQHP